MRRLDIVISNSQFVTNTRGRSAADVLETEEVNAKGANFRHTSNTYRLQQLTLYVYFTVALGKEYVVVMPCN